MLYGLFGSITLSEVRTVRGLLATWLQAHLDVVVEGVTTVREWNIHEQGGDPNEAVARYLSALRGGVYCGFLEMYAFSQIKAITVKTYASRGSDFVLRMVASPEGEAKETRRLLFVGRCHYNVLVYKRSCPDAGGASPAFQDCQSGLRQEDEPSHGGPFAAEDVEEVDCRDSVTGRATADILFPKASGVDAAQNGGRGVRRGVPAVAQPPARPSRCGKPTPERRVCGAETSVAEGLQETQSGSASFPISSNVADTSSDIQLSHKRKRVDEESGPSQDGDGSTPKRRRTNLSPPDPVVALRKSEYLPRRYIGQQRDSQIARAGRLHRATLGIWRRQGNCTSGHIAWAAVLRLDQPLEKPRRSEQKRQCQRFQGDPVHSVDESRGSCEETESATEMDSQVEVDRLHERILAEEARHLEENGQRRILGSVLNRSAVAGERRACQGSTCLDCAVCRMVSSI